jgi:hypothetical protein
MQSVNHSVAWRGVAYLDVRKHQSHLIDPPGRKQCPNL